jgi:hypothetical protein
MARSLLFLDGGTYRYGQRPRAHPDNSRLYVAKRPGARKVRIGEFQSASASRDGRSDSVDANPHYLPASQSAVPYSSQIPQWPEGTPGVPPGPIAAPSDTARRHRTRRAYVFGIRKDGLNGPMRFRKRLGSESKETGDVLTGQVERRCAATRYLICYCIGTPSGRYSHRSSLAQGTRRLL